MRLGSFGLPPFSSITLRRPKGTGVTVRGEEPGDENKDRRPEDDEEDKKNKKSRKTRKADDDEPDDEGDDEQDEKDEDDPEACAARSREKGRIRAIMSSPAAKRMPTAAQHIALETSMPRTAAIEMLAAMAKEGRGGSLQDRMAGLQHPEIGAGGPQALNPSDPKALAVAIVRAAAKARGEIG